jgi:hypothetical protein
LPKTIFQSWRVDFRRAALPLDKKIGASMCGSNSGTIGSMATVEKIVDQMRNSPDSVRFSDLHKVCEKFFGKPRLTAGSHVIFKMPWPGDPRVNIQNDKGRAKPYQVRQVLLAIDKLKGERL